MIKRISNIRNHKSKILFGLVLLIAILLRVWGLGSVPSGLTWDEASLGYNAYSILQTGKDEYGYVLPINLKSFGDYKPAFYAYLDIPFVAILGLNEWAVRLPSAMAGIGFAVLVFFITRRIFRNNLLAICCMFTASVLPLSFIFSRAAFESNVALFLNTLGFYLFLKSEDNKKFLIGSVIVFGLSMLTYQASRFFVPFFIGGLFLIFKEKLKINRITVGAFAIFIIFVSIVFGTTFLMGQNARLASQNFFAYQRNEQTLNQIQNEDGLAPDSFGFEFLHGEWFAYTRGLFERYLIYFSPKMLFLDGDYSPRHRVSDLGILYFYSIILIPLGIYYIFKNQNRAVKALLFWLIIAPLPGVLSRDLINFVRVLNIAFPIAVIEGIGLYFLTQLLGKQKKLLYPALVIIFCLISFNLSLYLDHYFIHTPVKYSQGFLYGHRQVFESIKDKNLADFNKVVITDTYGQPYIYYLFYTKYPPAKFQQQASLEQKTVDVGTVRKIDNIEFRHVFWPGDRGEKNSLFIGTLEELPDQDVKPFSEFKILTDINFLDKQHAFRVVETK